MPHDAIFDTSGEGKGKGSYLVRSFVDILADDDSRMESLHSIILRMRRGVGKESCAKEWIHVEASDSRHIYFRRESDPVFAPGDWAMRRITALWAEKQREKQSAQRLGRRFKEMTQKHTELAYSWKNTAFLGLKVDVYRSFLHVIFSPNQNSFNMQYFHVCETMRIGPPKKEHELVRRQKDERLRKQLKDFERLRRKDKVLASNSSALSLAALSKSVDTRDRPDMATTVQKLCVH